MNSLLYKQGLHLCKFMFSVSGNIVHIMTVDEYTQSDNTMNIKDVMDDKSITMEQKVFIRLFCGMPLDPTSGLPTLNDKQKEFFLNVVEIYLHCRPFTYKTRYPSIDWELVS